MTRDGFVNGHMAENVAVSFLFSHGFVILSRNYRFGHYEIDIIAAKEDCLHFCEVKFRASDSYGHPEEFVTSRQQERIKAAADDYIYNYNWHGKVQFDIISISAGVDGEKDVIFIEDAF